VKLKKCGRNPIFSSASTKVQREQTKIFKLENTGEKTEVPVIRAAYRQILSAILNPISPKTNSLPWKANGENGRREFIESLGSSNLYIKEVLPQQPR